jgi:hypothetical protein
MSFGTESATPVGGQTLTGFIVSKAMQSRKEAKKEDRKEKRKEKKEKQTKKENKQQEQKQGIGSKLLGSFPSLGNLFSAKKPPTKSAQQTQTRTSGGGTGLAKILTHGFGSLTADTMGVASGLASVTQLLNSSLRAQSFTATGVQTIASILSDQVENQGSILSTVKSLKPGGRTGGGGGGRGMFGSSKSSGIGGETLTGFVWGKIKDQVLSFLGGAAATQLGKVKNLFKPKVAATAKPSPTLSPKSTGRLTGSYDRFLQGKSNFGDRLRLLRKGQIGPGNMFTKGSVDALAKPSTGGGLGGGLKSFKSLLTPKNLVTGVKGFGIGLLGDMAIQQVGDAVGSKITTDTVRKINELPPERKQKAIQNLNQEWKKEREWQSGSGGMFDNIIQLGGLLGESSSQVKSGQIQRILSGLGQENKLASGGVMLGEAGKEAVVDLNSNQGRGLMGQQKGDPGMKASGAATLAVVDQFIKGMGQLGAPVSQALGSDIQNLARDFGMSQALPNLKIGGGKFKEDGSAAKKREQFLKELIAGSLDELGAKKEDNTATGRPAPNPPEDPGVKPDEERDPGAAADPSAPPAASAPSGNNKPMDDNKGGRADTKGFAYQPNLNANEAQGLTKGTNKTANQRTLPIKGYPNHFVLSDRSNGKFEVWEKGLWGVFGNKPKHVGSAKDKDTGKYKDPLFAAAFNEVRANYLNDGQDIGQQFGYINSTDIQNRIRQQNLERSQGNQQSGGTVQPVSSFDQGGRVQKPWWDFLGWATGAKEVKKGTTGIYSDSAMGRIGEAAAQRNKMMKELGYEKGGSMFGTESSNIDPMTDIRNRVKALEDIIAVTAITSAKQPTAKPPAPRSAPRSAPVGATSETSSDVSSAAIINIVAGSGQTAPVQEASQSSQSTAEYASNPWPSGLAGVICTSPWSIV